MTEDDREGLSILSDEDQWSSGLDTELNFGYAETRWPTFVSLEACLLSDALVIRDRKLEELTPAKGGRGARCVLWDRERWSGPVGARYAVERIRGERFAFGVSVTEASVRRLLGEVYIHRWVENWSPAMESFSSGVLGLCRRLGTATGATWATLNDPSWAPPIGNQKWEPGIVVFKELALRAGWKGKTLAWSDWFWVVPWSE